MTERKGAYRTKRKKQATADRSQYEDAFAIQIRAAGLPEPTREFLFHPIRKWRFDFGWPDELVAAEVEGGIYSNGRHVTPAGFIEDCRKYNEATLLGWRVLRLPMTWIETGEALRYVEMALRGKSEWTPMKI